MRPERQAAERELYESNELPKKALKFAVGTAATIGLGGGKLAHSAFNKLSKFLNPALPTSIAAQAIMKSVPGGDKYFDSVASNGYTQEEGIDNIRKQTGYEENIEPLEKKRRETLGKFNEKVKKRKLAEEEQSRVQQSYPQFAQKPPIAAPQPMQAASPQQPQQPQGPGQEAWIKTLQRINESLQ